MLMNHNQLPTQVAAPAPGAPIRGRYPDVPSGLARDAFYAGPTHDRDVLVLVDGDDGLTRLHLLGEISFDRNDARLLVDRDRATLGAGIPTPAAEHILPQSIPEPATYTHDTLSLAALSTAGVQHEEIEHRPRHRAPETDGAGIETFAAPPTDPLGKTHLSLYDKIKLEFESELGSFELPDL